MKRVLICTLSLAISTAAPMQVPGAEIGDVASALTSVLRWKMRWHELLPSVKSIPTGKVVRVLYAKAPSHVAVFATELRINLELPLIDGQLMRPTLRSWMVGQTNADLLKGYMDGPVVDKSSCFEHRNATGRTDRLGEYIPAARICPPARSETHSSVIAIGEFSYALPDLHSTVAVRRQSLLETPQALATAISKAVLENMERQSLPITAAIACYGNHDPLINVWLTAADGNEALLRIGQDSAGHWVSGKVTYDRGPNDLRHIKEEALRCSAHRLTVAL